MSHYRKRNKSFFMLQICSANFLVCRASRGIPRYALGDLREKNGKWGGGPKIWFSKLNIHPWTQRSRNPYYVQPELSTGDPYVGLKGLEKSHPADGIWVLFMEFTAKGGGRARLALFSPCGGPGFRSCHQKLILNHQASSCWPPAIFWRVNCVMYNV